jgi:hypothetical protein
VLFVLVRNSTDSTWFSSVREKPKKACTLHPPPGHQHHRQRRYHVWTSRRPLCRLHQQSHSGDNEPMSLHLPSPTHIPVRVRSLRLAARCSIQNISKRYRVNKARRTTYGVSSSNLPDTFLPVSSSTTGTGSFSPGISFPSSVFCRLVWYMIALTAAHHDQRAPPPLYSALPGTRHIRRRSDRKGMTAWS